MGKALYRKYRSRSLSEIVGQEHITATLDNALKQGRIAHAYLLTGPRGVGKTSVARILAHEVNGLPYSEETNLDIIEIDAASNNGVEDVRTLREKIPSAPVSAKYKVIIIDEVHMLSKAAFNALLKTLEEPPAHVIFILATTESHKLPETIISRTQRYSFRPVPADKAAQHLKSIAKQEKINIDDDALTLIAEHAEGSLRDSTGLLDQASNISDHITRNDIERLIGRAPQSQIQTLLSSVAQQSNLKVISTLRELIEQGYEPAMIAIQLGQQLRDSVVQGKPFAGLSYELSLHLLRDLLDIPPAHNPEALLELVLLGANPAADSVQPSQNATIEPVAVKNADTSSAPQPPEVVVLSASKPEQIKAPETLPAETEPKTATATDPASALWQDVLQQIKQSHNTLYGIARMARPTLSDDTLTLELTFAFHQKRLNEPSNKAILTKVIEELRHAPTQVACILATDHRPTKPASDSVTTISNIFGGAELLES